jgi:predicted 2-oxoglutarate/Fe(II)-dependent dioxygenase YbiX
MEKYEINKILDLYHSKDYSEKIIRWKYSDISNFWLHITKFKEFDFVRDIINKDLQNIGYNDYRCAEFVAPSTLGQGPITLLIYEKGDFFGEHSDTSTYGSGILSGNYLLNDEYKGGNFILDGKKLEVGVGELFTYGRDVLHEVTEVTGGVRYSLHFFIDKL